MSLLPSCLWKSSNPFRSSPPVPTSACPGPMPSDCTVRIAVVGDVHDDWDLEDDAKALRFLQADLVLFTGDFGNENVDLVRSISKLELPKAAILGNHDARASQFSKKLRKKDLVQLQLDCLGEAHVGYRRLGFPSLDLTVIGGRPFSCGGDRLFCQGLLSSRYGVNDMEGSADKIYKVTSGSPKGSVIILAHNGPTGLGSKRSDICGRDWEYEGGDHGDPDLAQALGKLKRTTSISIPLVVFGHMHKNLAYSSGLRKMMVVGDDKTIYLNGAIVPRVKHYTEPGTDLGSSSGNQANSPNTSTGTVRAFTVIEMQDRVVQRISETWVLVMDDKSEVAEESILYENVHVESNTPI